MRADPALRDVSPTPGERAERARDRLEARDAHALAALQRQDRNEPGLEEPLRGAERQDDFGRRSDARLEALLEDVGGQALDLGRRLGFEIPPLLFKSAVRTRAHARAPFPQT